MEANKATRLHPLLTAAAVSVTVFSAVGVAALTGLIPPSISSGKSEAPMAVSLAPQAAAPVQQSPQPVAEPVPAPLPPAKTVSTPKPVKKPAVAKSTPASFPAEPPVYRDYGPVAQAPVPQAPVAEPMKAPQALNVGTVESVREIAEKGDGTGLGAVAGGVAGAVVGKQFGNGSGKTIMTVLGAAGGAYAGHEVEKRVRGAKRWEVTVRMEDGTSRTVSTDAQPQWRTGDRVRMIEGRLQPV
jgi:outer membrane lipoprotein SlyB